jgi:CDP-glucose 4,6-dehydratase
MGEKDPYGASKGAAELVVRSYRDSFFPVSAIEKHGIKIASARAGNVIGGGDWTEHALIVDAVKAVTMRNPIQVRSPDAFRPWQHVLQALSGYLTLAQKLLTTDDSKYCSGWNIGPVPGNELPVRNVVQLFLDEWEMEHGSTQVIRQHLGKLAFCVFPSTRHFGNLTGSHAGMYENLSGKQPVGTVII